MKTTKYSSAPDQSGANTHEADQSGANTHEADQSGANTHEADNTVGSNLPIRRSWWQDDCRFFLQSGWHRILMLLTSCYHQVVVGYESGAVHKHLLLCSTIVHIL